jgi:hypothetical protein
MTQLRKVADGLRTRFARTAAVLEEAAEDVLAYRLFPSDHQRQLHSTNVLERLNKATKRRSNVVGIFPSPKATIRLVGAILLEQDEEWSIAERRYFSAESMKQLSPPALPPSAQNCLPQWRRGTIRCERLWKTSVVFQDAVGGVCAVHGIGSVHVAGDLADDARLISTT